MDPLSVAASVVGLLSAAGKMSQLLTKLIAMADAPDLARVVLAEMNDTTVALGHLQEYLIGTNDMNPDRKRFILLEHIVAILTNSVTTYSELETIIVAVRINPVMGAFDRFKWINKEKEIRDIIQRMQNHKSSLTLMLSILQCKTNQEAERSTRRLCGLVEQLVTTNRDLSMRLCRLETHSSRRPKQDDFSIISATHGDIDKRQSTQNHAIGFSSSVEKSLQASRAYGRCQFQHSETSLTSSARRTNIMSIFTSLSLAEISNISVFSLPIHASDISNSDWYTFGLPSPLSSSTISYTTSLYPRTGDVIVKRDSDTSGRLATNGHAQGTTSQELLFQNFYHKVKKQRAVKFVDNKESQTLGNSQTNNKVGEQHQLATFPVSDERQAKALENLQGINELEGQHQIAKSSASIPEPALQSVGPIWMAVLYDFENHARTCINCHDPYKVHLVGKRLCDKGHELAQEIACFLYKNSDDHNDSMKIEDLRLQKYAIPSDYVQVGGLLLATEAFLQDNRLESIPLSNPRESRSLHSKDRKPRSSNIYARKSSTSLTEFTQDAGTSLIGKTPEPRRPHSGNRVVSYYPNRNQGSFPQVDFRRRSVI